MDVEEQIEQLGALADAIKNGAISNDAALFALTVALREIATWIRDRESWEEERNEREI